MPFSSLTSSLVANARRLSFVVLSLLVCPLGQEARAQGAQGPAGDQRPVVTSEKGSSPKAKRDAKAAPQATTPGADAQAAEVVGEAAPEGSLAETAPKPEKKEAPQTDTPVASGAGGVVVFVDPVTGQIRQPDAEEIGRLLALERAKVTVGAPLVEKALPGGGVGVLLDSSFDSFMVVTKQPDGKLSMGCVTGEKKAKEAVSAGATAAQKPEAKEVPDVE